MRRTPPASPSFERPFLETVLSADSDTIDSHIEEFPRQDASDRNHHHYENGSSIWSSIGNFTNAIAGAGALGLGGAFAKSGGVVSLLLVIFFGIVTRMSLDMLIHLSIIADVHSFEGLGRLAFGYKGKLAVSVAKFLYSFGCLVAYVVVLKDNLGPAVKSLVYMDEPADTFWYRFWSESFLVTWTFSSVIILPLCMLRDMTPLANLSMLSILSMIAIAFILVYFCFVGNVGKPGEGVITDWFAVKDGTLECLGTFVFTFVSQHTVHLAFNSLKPSLRTYANWKRVSGASIGIAAAISLTIGVSVYATFFEATESDIFKLYPHGPLVSLAQLLLCATMLLTFPLPFFACRELVIINLFPDTREVIDDESPIIEEPLIDETVEEPDLERAPSPENETLEANDAHVTDLDSLREPLLAPNTTEDDEPSVSGDDESLPIPALEASVSFADLSLATAAQAINSIFLPGCRHQLKLPYHMLVTGKLWFVATGLAIAAPNLGDVLDVVGCASGTLIAFVFPSMISLRLMGWNAIAVFLLAIGSLVGSVGTYFSIRQLLADLHL